MTASTLDQQPLSTVERALQSLRVTRQTDEPTERETVFAQPGYFTNLAASEARSGRIYSD